MLCIFHFSECWLPITDMTSLFLRYDASTVLTILDGDRMFSYDPESPLYSQKGWRSAVDDPEPSLIVVFRYKHSDIWYYERFPWTKILNHGINVDYQKTNIYASNMLITFTFPIISSSNTSLVTHKVPSSMFQWGGECSWIWHPPLQCGQYKGYVVWGRHYLVDVLRSRSR